MFEKIDYVNGIQNRKKRGGARSGAGRPRSFATRKTREIADAAVLMGNTPLEVMLSLMRKAVDAGSDKEAALYAQMAAPYVHPRLATVNGQQNHTGKITIKNEFAPHDG